MPLAQLLHVSYALMTDGATSEAIEELDAQLAADEEGDKLADIIALGGEIG